MNAKELGAMNAHPVPDEYIDHPVHGWIHKAQLGAAGSPGMTKREAFAMAAMQGLVVHGFITDGPAAASLAVCHADALLAELVKDQP